MDALYKKHGLNPNLIKYNTVFSPYIASLIATHAEILAALDGENSQNFEELIKLKQELEEALAEAYNIANTKDRVQKTKELNEKIKELNVRINQIPGVIEIKKRTFKERATEKFREAVAEIQEAIDNYDVENDRPEFTVVQNKVEASKRVLDYILKYNVKIGGEFVEFEPVLK